MKAPRKLNIKGKVEREFDMAARAAKAALPSFEKYVRQCERMGLPSPFLDTLRQQLETLRNFSCIEGFEYDIPVAGAGRPIQDTPTMQDYIQHIFKDQVIASKKRTVKEARKPKPIEDVKCTRPEIDLSDYEDKPQKPVAIIPAEGFTFNLTPTPYTRK